MALVSYGSSGESDLSEDEDEVEVKPSKVENLSKVENSSNSSQLIGKPVEPSSIAAGEISDEEDEAEWIGKAPVGIEDLDIPGLSTSKSFFASLPQASSVR